MPPGHVAGGEDDVSRFRIDVLRRRPRTDPLPGAIEIHHRRRVLGRIKGPLAAARRQATRDPPSARRQKGEYVIAQAGLIPCS
jgi:hypothetical protein